MSYCLNPGCQKPNQNPLHVKYCQQCGEKLLLQDRYRALGIIGQGGFGKTFLAVDEVLGSHPRCVIKQFFLQGQSQQVTQKAIELFRQEAQRLKMLGKHSQIPELYTFLEQNNQLYIVQEFIQGNTLAQEVAQKGAFTEKQIRSLLADLLPVLSFIAQGQIIHRDIKPENIIRRQSDQKLVLVDFGAAKEVTQTALMRTGTMIGSAGYAAPEQAHGKAVFASDLFSLGATCIHLLTNVEPSHLYDPIENQYIWKDKVINPVSHELTEILDTMTHALARQRYQSASEILQALKGRKPISSRTAPTLAVKPPNKTKIQKKTKFPVFIKGLAVSVVAGSGFLGWQLFNPPQSRIPSLPVSKTTEAVKPLPEITPPPSALPSPVTVIKPTPEPIEVQPKVIKPKNPVNPVSVPKKATPTRKTVKAPPPVSKISETPRKNTVKSKPKTRYTAQRKPSYRVSQPKKVKVAARRKPSTQQASTSAVERTIRSNISRQRKSPIARRNTSSDMHSVPQPWAEKNVPNPTSEIENTIRGN